MTLREWTMKETLQITPSGKCGMEKAGPKVCSSQGEASRNTENTQPPGPTGYKSKQKVGPCPEEEHLPQTPPSIGRLKRHVSRASSQRRKEEILKGWKADAKGTSGDLYGLGGGCKRKREHRQNPGNSSLQGMASGGGNE